MAQNRMSFADYLYNRLPQVYRTSDTEQVLRRFIETFAEAGFDPLLQETMDIMNLIDVDKCPSEFLPLLCSYYGFEYTVEIPELFIRRLLKHIIELYKRKGTKSVVKFIARELTGFDSEIIENKDFDEELIEITHWDIRFEHYRNFVLKLNAPYEDSVLYNKEEIVKKLVTDFLPTNSQVLVITVYWFQEEYNKNIVEHDHDTFYNVIYEGEFTDLIKKFTYNDTKFDVKQEYTDEKTLTLSIELNHDHFKVTDEKYTEYTAPSDLSSENSTLDTLRDFNSEELEVGRIFHNDYDIIKEKNEETLTTHFKDHLNENSFLNVSTPLMTNGIHSWSVIKEQGKPDKLILL